MSIVPATCKNIQVDFKLKQTNKQKYPVNSLQFCN